METVKKLASGTELPITDIKGKPYLKVPWRLVWFREEHPDWGIRTKLIKYNKEKGTALFKAVILDNQGNIMATAHKMASYKEFPQGFIEKAETGAVGRALAMCGYGTQFEPEFDEEDMLADSP